MVESSFKWEIIAEIQKEAPISQKIYNQLNSTRYGALQFSIFLFHNRFSGKIDIPYTKWITDTLLKLFDVMIDRQVDNSTDYSINFCPL